MATTNRERVDNALSLLQEGLGPFVDREIKSALQSGTLDPGKPIGFSDYNVSESNPIAEWDVAGLLKLMSTCWKDVFRYTLGYTERSLISELSEHRNKWAHQGRFSSNDTHRVLDSAERLLTAIAAPQAQELGKRRKDLMRLVFEEQVRDERRKQAGALIASASSSGLPPWREVITPHADVASGNFEQAEFAADLWQVYLKEGSDEYRDAAEFFRRTFLTKSLEGLLSGAIRRLAGRGGNPVVQLQTNFGGGKTHSMLALYHLFSGRAPEELEGVGDLMAQVEETSLVKAKRVVLVGNKISPGNPKAKPYGVTVRTLWGELAWQLGGKKAFDRVANDDKNATNPGDVLRQLFVEYGPCLVLIDEWVAYARQLHDQSDLPGGSFETQFSFAQVLTESAKNANNCLLVISLPASDTAGTMHEHADDVEVGGLRGRQALSRLENVIGRIESSWRPASAEEGFEIVRRRLFEPMREQAQFKSRDIVARAFVQFYRSHGQEFPKECRDVDYETRIKAAFPIHPEVFDRLYTDWSTLVKFQRTRGVLRLMASVIHGLWHRQDKSPLILPANIAMDDLHVLSELTRYLPDNWAPVIEKDVDGANSLPVRTDGEVTNLGKYAATRRVARTIFLGSAPTAKASHEGIEDRRIRLGSVLPGEPPAVFGDALRRLAAAATYLYQDGSRYWYSTRPTVLKMAEELAESFKNRPDEVVRELDKQLKADLRDAGDFKRVHCMPQFGHDVPDERSARLVVLGIDHLYSKESGNPAEKAANEILKSRGKAPRVYGNTLVFLAADRSRWQDLDEAIRRFLAWSDIVDQSEDLDLSPQQVKQAENSKKRAADTVESRIPETYHWLLAPARAAADKPLEWKVLSLAGRGPRAVKASSRLKKEELLVISYAPTLLRMELDDVPLWHGDHESVRKIVDYFAKHLYLPRLANSTVLLRSISDGISQRAWYLDAFAYADSFDAEENRYRGLRAGQDFSLQDPDSPGLLVKPEVALRQMEADRRRQSSTDEPTTTEAGGATGGSGTQPDPGGVPPIDPGARKPRRFHGSVTLDSARVGVDASRIADEVIVHLSGLVGAEVKVTLEIRAEVQDGAPDHVVRAVTENCRTLNFTHQGFELD